MATSKRERQKAGRREKLERQQRHQKRRKNLRRSLIVAVIAILVFGTGALLFVGKPTTTTTTIATPQVQANAKAVAAGCPASTSTRVNTLTWTKAPAMTITTAKTYYANFATTAGNFVVKLDAKTAPITTNNFVFLAQHQYYKCVIFHRVIPGFMIQGGDPTGTGTGGPGYTIADELPKAGSPTYPLYSLAMANTGQVHTGGSQFFIVTGTTGETLKAQYSLFGQVVSGSKVVNVIQNAGNPSTTASGVPPIVTHRILNITISEK